MFFVALRLALRCKCNTRMQCSLTARFSPVCSEHSRTLLFAGICSGSRKRDSAAHAVRLDSDAQLRAAAAVGLDGYELPAHSQSTRRVRPVLPAVTLRATYDVSARCNSRQRTAQIGCHSREAGPALTCVSLRVIVSIGREWWATWLHRTREKSGCIFRRVMAQATLAREADRVVLPTGRRHGLIGSFNHDWHSLPASIDLLFSQQCCIGGCKV